MLFFKRTFQNKIEAANRILNSTIEKLKSIQADMVAQIEKNKAKIQSLESKNSELEEIRTKTEKQIGEISKFIV